MKIVREVELYFQDNKHKIDKAIASIVMKMLREQKKVIIYRNENIVFQEYYIESGNYYMDTYITDKPIKQQVTVDEFYEILTTLMKITYQREGTLLPDLTINIF